MSNKKRKKRSSERKEAAGTAVYTVIKIVALVIFVMVVFRAGKTAYTFGERIFGEPAMAEEPGEDITIVVEQGDSVNTIAQKLENAGLIRDARLFVLQEKLAGYKSGLQAGTYVLNTSQTPDEIIQILASSSGGEEGEEG